MYKPKRILRQPRIRPSARRPLEIELQRLQDNMLAMGSRVSRNILDSVESYRTQNLETANYLIQSDKEVNERRFELEGDCLKLIATQNPIARDLRTIAAIIEMTTELERINDYAKGIAKITRRVGCEPSILPSADLPQMALKAQGMLRRALFAFIERDVAMAYTIATLDDEVDLLYNRIFHWVMEQVVAAPQAVEHANYQLWVAHNLERTGDRALNICERVIFTVTGKLIELDTELR